MNLPLHSRRLGKHTRQVLRTRGPKQLLLALQINRQQIHVQDIKSVELGQTTFWTGWGLRVNVQGERIWNLSGYDCVVIRHKETTWVGTNEAETLLRFLKTKLPTPADLAGRS